MKRTVALLKLLMEGEAAWAMAPNKGSSKMGELVPRRNGKGHIIYYTISYIYINIMYIYIYVIYIYIYVHKIHWNQSQGQERDSRKKHIQYC